TGRCPRGSRWPRARGPREGRSSEHDGAANGLRARTSRVSTNHRNPSAGAGASKESNAPRQGRIPRMRRLPYLCAAEHTQYAARRGAEARSRGTVSGKRTALHAAVYGNRTTKDVGQLGVSCTLIVPPCAATASRQKKRPIPVVPCSATLPEYFSKIVSRSPRGIAGPS